MISWIVLVLLFTISFPAFAQSDSRKPSLELGTVIARLGMSRQQVVSLCANAGFNQVLFEENEIVFENGGQAYTTAFQNGRLVYADRDWYSKQNDFDAFQSTMAALASIAGSEGNRGLSTCTISHQPRNTPDSQANRVVITCGSRSFLLLDSKMGGKTYYGVYERIGEMVQK
ncbi:MAG TPA: hypothetical protein VFA85_08545 [Terriglobales bacterium]|nr:hypothetical protein [Terriglobales bacterium]